MFDRILRQPASRVILSILWGLGLAALFRRTCRGNRCIVIEGPSLNEVRNTLYQYEGEDDCYRFEAYEVECGVGDEVPSK